MLQKAFAAFHFHAVSVRHIFNIFTQKDNSALMSGQSVLTWSYLLFRLQSEKPTPIYVCFKSSTWSCPLRVQMVKFAPVKLLIDKNDSGLETITNDLILMAIIFLNIKH